MRVGLRRWVYEQVWGNESEWRPVRELVEHGIMEVEGPPPDGRPRWRHRELVNNITDLEGHRSPPGPRPQPHAVRRVHMCHRLSSSATQPAGMLSAVLTAAACIENWHRIKSN